MMDTVHPTVIALAGEWDIYRRDELRQILGASYDERDVVLDMSAVTYADSTLLSELVLMRKHRLTNDLPRVALVPSKPFERILTITGMKELWPCFSTAESAVSSFEGNKGVCDPSTPASPQP
jgi:anti-anti-sigma factor